MGSLPMAAKDRRVWYICRQIDVQGIDCDDNVVLSLGIR